jgi:signal peptidase I
MTLTAVRRSTGRLVSALLLLVALVLAALFLAPKLLGYETYVITTGSMTGTAGPGSLVISQRVPADRLAVGDVVTYAPPAATGIDHLVTHRITEIGEDEAGARTFRTKGDANPVVDFWTFSFDSAEQPRMVLSVPELGRPVLWMADRQTRMLALGLPALVIALLALRDVVDVLRPAPRSTPGQAAPAAGGPEPADLPGSRPTSSALTTV